MDPERWQRIKDVFSTALEIPRSQRAAWLASALPDDPSLAGEVEGLLDAHDGVDDFYEQGALALVPEVSQQLEGAVEGMRFGPYRVISELGRGGMGAVYLAVRDQPGFTQTVAIKLIKRGMDTDQIVRRFVAERQILASLSHPNIARLLDGGSTPDGRPYFVMEHVEGKPITFYADVQKLSIEARLRLFLRVCRAVQRAHQSLVVHRDLKPANILVDAEGEPKLLDFGIAKLLDPTSFGGIAALTGHAPGPMTPEYASPEQYAGGPVTTATDVYSLGVLLYELLVGQSPRSVERKLGKGWAERPPSHALAALKEAKNVETRRLARRLTGDLDTIVGKALEHDPERRYGTAAALAEDLERHLTQRPVVARRPTLRYRLSRGLVRHKFAATLALAVCLFAIISFYLFLDARRQQRRAEAERQRAETVNSILNNLIREANPEQNRGETLTVRQVLDEGAQDLLNRKDQYDPETLAAALAMIGTTYSSLGSYEKAHGYLEQALKLREQQHNPSREAALDIAGNLTALGNVAYRQGKYDGSNYHRRAIAIKERLLGSGTVSLVENWNGLGLNAIAEGDHDAAATHFKKSLAICHRAEEGGQTELADTLNELGFLATAQGKPARAELLFRAASGHYSSVLGDDHPSTILARRNLAFALFERAEYDEAETLYQESVDMRRHLLEPDHPDLASALRELATLQAKRGRWAEAKATLSELLEIRQKYRFPADQEEAETWNLLGHVYLEENQLDAAEEAFKKNFEVYRSLPGEHRSDLANALSGQATVRRLRADLNGAIALARRSLELTRAAEGEMHPAVADKLRSLAELLHEAGQFRRAETAYRQALNLRSGSEWTDHPDKAVVLTGFGGLLTETGRAEEALPHLEDALRIRRLALPARDPAIARTESRLGACYAALGDERARALLEHGYQMLLELQGPDHPETRKALDRLRRSSSPAG